MDLITFKNISFSRRNNFHMDDISFQITSGKITTLVGPNGSGKSTLLRLLMRLLTPNKGEILLGDKNITAFSAKEYAKKMTMLAQSPEGMIDVVVRDLVSYGRVPHRSFLSGLQKEDEDAIDWAIEVCRLGALAYRPIHTLSGGERQRAWLAMALAQKTPILLLDEPTTYLDIAHQLELLDLLKELNEKYGLTIILVLHDLNQAALYSDHCIVCEDGAIKQVGSPKEVFTEALLEEVFHISAELSTRAGKLSIQPIASTRFGNN